MTIETERLFLREMKENDFDALYEVLADADIMQHYRCVSSENLLAYSGEPSFVLLLTVGSLAESATSWMIPFLFKMHYLSEITCFDIRFSVKPNTRFPFINRVFLQVEE